RPWGAYNRGCRSFLKLHGSYRRMRTRCAIGSSYITREVGRRARVYFSNRAGGPKRPVDLPLRLDDANCGERTSVAIAADRLAMRPDGAHRKAALGRDGG